MLRSVLLASCVFALFSCTGCLPGFDSEETETQVNFGRFEGTVVASWDENGRHMTLREPFKYIDSKDRTWVAPAGTTVDGASIPAAFWTFIGGPFEGKYRNASVVHDIGCIEMTESWEDVHYMFYEACRCAGVDESQAKMLYYAVYHFGPRWEPVTETVIEQQQMPDGQIVEKEVLVKHMSRVDPLPPTPAEMKQMEEFVANENPEPEKIEKVCRGDLHRFCKHGAKPLNSPDKSSETAQDHGHDHSQGHSHGAGHHSQPRSFSHANSPNNGNSPRPFTYGGNSHTGQGYSRHRRSFQGNIPTVSDQEQQWAIQQVEQHITQQMGSERPADYSVERTRGGYRVVVQFLHQDEQGQMVPDEGGICTVRLSRRGEILELISGTQTAAAPQDTNTY